MTNPPQKEKKNKAEENGGATRGREKEKKDGSPGSQVQDSQVPPTRWRSKSKDPNVERPVGSSCTTKSKKDKKEKKGKKNKDKKLKDKKESKQKKASEDAQDCCSM